MRYPRLRSVRPFRADVSYTQGCLRWRNYYHLMRMLVHLHSGWIARTSDLDVKILMGIHVYEDCVIAGRIADRIQELLPPGAITTGPSSPLIRLTEELDNLATWQEYAAAVYNVIKPALIDAWDTHLVGTDTLLDEPSSRLLHDFLRITSQHINGGMALIETVLFHGGETADQVHKATSRMRDLWRELGSDPFNAPNGPEPTPLPLRHDRCIIPARDKACTVISQRPHAIPHLPGGWTDHEHRLFLHHYMHQCLITAEVLTLTSYENPTMPYEYHLTLTRSAWAAIRHVQATEQVLIELGGNWADFPVFLHLFQEVYPMPPRERMEALLKGRTDLWPTFKISLEWAAKHLDKPQLLSVLDYLGADLASNRSQLLTLHS